MSITIQQAQTIRGGVRLHGSRVLTGSMYFNGDGYILNNTVADIVPGTGDFTVEWFQNIDPNSSGNTRIWEISPWNNTYWGVSEEGWSAGRSFYYWDTPGTYANLGYVTDTHGVWSHMALVRASGTLTLYINGTVMYSQANAADISNTDFQLSIGGEAINNDALLTGYITNFRITHNAQYTSAFTPLVGPLTAVAGTVLLMLASDAGSMLTDSSGLGHTWTPYLNGVTWSSNTPFTG